MHMYILGYISILRPTSISRLKININSLISRKKSYFFGQY